MRRLNTVYILSYEEGFSSPLQRRGLEETRRLRNHSKHAQLRGQRVWTWDFISLETFCSLEPVLYCLSCVDQWMPSSLPSFSFTETDDLCMEKGMKKVIISYKYSYINHLGKEENTARVSGAPVCLSQRHPPSEPFRYLFVIVLPHMFTFLHFRFVLPEWQLYVNGLSLMHSFFPCFFALNKMGDSDTLLSTVVLHSFHNFVVVHCANMQ